MGALHKSYLYVRADTTKLELYENRKSAILITKKISMADFDEGICALAVGVSVLMDEHKGWQVEKNGSEQYIE